MAKGNKTKKVNKAKVLKTYEPRAVENQNLKNWQKLLTVDKS